MYHISLLDYGQDNALDYYFLELPLTVDKIY